MDFKTIWEEARKAGLEAGSLHTPKPMVVVQHANPLDDNSPVVHQYEPIMDGVCGFAWVNVKPGNSAFSKWLMSNGLARRDSYSGGVTINIHEYNQSYERKEKHAEAMAKVFQSNGIRAYAGSRLD